MFIICFFYDILKMRLYIICKKRGCGIMKKRINVTIGGNDYRLVSAENEEYTRKVAAHVDGKVQELLSMGNFSIIDAAILTSVNLADEYFKALETAESLRSQVKDYLEDSGRMKMEIADLKRQLDRYKK